jgi:cation diffusion facilitator CzcD-associated flavoprotein CzcO
LVVFQRTSPWILPRLDHPVSALRRWLYRWVPGFQRVSRWARYWLNELFVLGFLFPRIFKLVEGRAKKYLASQVADAALREKLEPNYRMGCKRILISDDYYPALQRPNVRLETTTIEKVTAKGVRTVDGVEHELDCLVLATGFHATDPLGPVEVLGRDRQSLRAAWADGLSAYLGTTVAGFPNLFMLAGPNTGIGHTSLVFMIEAQLHYALKAMRAVRRDVSGAVEVRADVQQQFNAALRERSKTTVWQAGGCRSWYLDEHGRNTTVWPGSTVRFWLKTRRFEPQAHVITLTPERAPAMESA